MPDSDIVSTGGGQGFPAENRDGSPGLVGKDDYTRELAIKKASRGTETVLAGNFADLQRLGADRATGTVNINSAVQAPPGVDPAAKNVVTPAQAEASRGEFTRETERTGLVTAPVVPDPPEDNSPNVVDPTSTSPTVESKSASTTPTKK